MDPQVKSAIRWDEIDACLKNWQPPEECLPSDPDWKEALKKVVSEN